MAKKQDPVIHLRLDKDLKSWLEKRADRVNKTTCSYIREVLEMLKYLEGEKK